MEDPGKINLYLDLLFRYGAFWVYLAIFIACFIENIFPPFPGDSFVVAAGALVGVNRLEFWPTFVVVVAGGVLSVMILYYWGNRYGRDFFIKKNYKYLPSTDIIKFEEKFNKWGALILIFSRFIVGIRSVLALGAGISRFNPFFMFLFTLISYFLFAGFLMSTSIKLVENIETMKEYFNVYNLIIWPAVILLIVLYFIRKYRTSKERGN